MGRPRQSCPRCSPSSPCCSSPPPWPPLPRSLTCDICVDVVTDLDEWLTSDTTEQQIVEWVEQVCSFLSAIVPEAICKSLIEAQLPAIIDGLVNDNLNPQEVCTSIGACTTPATTTAAPATTTAAPATTTAAPATTTAAPATTTAAP